MGRHTAPRPPLWLRAQTLPGLIAQRSPLGLTAGVAVMALTATTATAAFVVTPAVTEAESADATNSQDAADGTEQATAVVDSAAAVLARADQVAAAETIDDTTVAQIEEVSAELDALVAAAGGSPEVTAERSTTEAASRSVGREAAPEDAELVADEVAEAEDGEETAEPAADAPASEKATETPTAETSAESETEGDEATVTADAETTAEIAAATAELTNLLNVAEKAIPVSVEAAPTEEEIAAEKAAKEAAEAEALEAELAEMAGSTAAYSNGNIPASALCSPDFDPSALLRCDAAHQLESLNDAYKAQFGRDIAITDSYRSYGSQVSVKASKGSLAAVPGTSNHGWGTAVDIGDAVGGFGSVEYNWMRANAPTYGWDNPDWARAGGANPESWHWEYGTAP